MIILRSFVVFLMAVASTLAECPSPEVASPCFCKNTPFGEQLHCKETSIATAQTTLKRISKSLVKDKHFSWLVITIDEEANSTEIPANFTDSLTFEGIDITLDHDTCNLTLPPMRVHESAFAGTRNRLRHFILACFNVSIGPRPFNIFDSINSFTNIKALTLAGVANIPAAAFKPLNQLKQLIILGPVKPYLNPIDDDQSPVGVDAFYQLNNVTVLGMTLDYIPANALRMKQSKVMLHLAVGSPNFNESSFAVGSLNQIQRPASLWLGTNKIRFIQENVFRPFLDADPKNLLNLNYPIPLNCSDCRNAWLAKQQDKYKAKVLDAYCDGDRNGPKVFDKKFEQCK